MWAFGKCRAIVEAFLVYCCHCLQVNKFSKFPKIVETILPVQCTNFPKRFGNFDNTFELFHK